MVGFRLFRLFLILASFPAFLGFLALGLSDRWIEQQATHWLYDRVEDLPEADVALVLGCAKTLSNGRSNLYFQYRIDAAAEAFTKGKCRYLIVSGDNSIQSYNEPDLMKEALILRGVPEDRIVCDYAGLRTLDSVVRANKIFGQRALLVISQQFHNERAIYIARQSGIEMIGLNAEDTEEFAPKPVRSLPGSKPSWMFTSSTPSHGTSVILSKSLRAITEKGRSNNCTGLFKR